LIYILSKNNKQKLILANNRFIGVRNKKEDGTYGDYEYQTYSEFFKHIEHIGYVNKLFFFYFLIYIS